MITVKYAVAAATRYLEEILGGASFSNLRVEEVDRTQTGNWLITLGFDVPVQLTSIEQVIGKPRSEREYKIFEVSSESGEVSSMKIRTA